MNSGAPVKSFAVADHTVGADASPFVVAEISGNHGGDIGKAFALIEAAAESGANAVKFQTYEPQTITIRNDGPAFVVQTDLWKGQSLYDLYEKAQTPFAWHDQLFAKAESVGIAAFSAPFDPSAVDLLEALKCPLYKIASCELVDIPLIEKVAATGKPMIMSTGMASFDEIDEAIACARGAGAQELAILHCISGYPSTHADANLATMVALRERFGCIVGLSDHSPGSTIATAAVALGAKVIEKHIYLERGDGSVDSDFSLSPSEFKNLVQDCRNAHAALGQVVNGATTAEQDSLRFRRSLFVVANMAKGEAFTEENLRSIRPSGGLHTRNYADLMGQKAACDIRAGTALAWDMVDKNGCET